MDGEGGGQVGSRKIEEEEEVDADYERGDRPSSHLAGNRLSGLVLFGGERIGDTWRLRKF